MQQRLIRYRTKPGQPPVQETFTEIGSYRFLTG
jgi:hypothetical protein